MRTAVPEGDTIHRTASTLDRVLAGRQIRRFAAPRLAGPLPAVGTVVSGVEARGKHVLIHLADGATVRTHLGMYGSWHHYRPGERWRKPAHRARLVIEVDGAVAVCFGAAVVEVVATDRLGVHAPLARLGPDLAGEAPDLDEALRRMARLVEPGTPAAEALLNQRVACGVGNVFKSEVLWACEVDPFAAVERLPEATRRELLATAARLLRTNLDGYPRRTVPDGLAVYGRRGRPCRRCGAPIRARRHGDLGRMTYWCPACQPEGSVGPARPPRAG